MMSLDYLEQSGMHLLSLCFFFTLVIHVVIIIIMSVCLTLGAAFYQIESSQICRCLVISVHLGAFDFVVCLCICVCLCVCVFVCACK